MIDYAEPLLRAKALAKDYERAMQRGKTSEAQAIALRISAAATDMSHAAGAMYAERMGVERRRKGDAVAEFVR